MTDEPIIPPSTREGAAPGQEPARPVQAEDVRRLIDDPEIEPDDRRARLEAMARYAAEGRDPDDAPSLIEMQIEEALALVAEGGHSYGSADPFGYDELDRPDVDDGEDAPPRD